MNELKNKEISRQNDLFCACLLIFFLCLKMLMNAARLNIITVHLMLTVLIYLALLNAIANLDTQEMAWIVLVGFLNLS